MNHKNIVVDANILIRAVLGKRVFRLILLLTYPGLATSYP